MNAVIAAATGMKHDDLKVFVRSFQKHISDAQLFLMVLEDTDWLNEYGFINRVIVHPTKHISLERYHVALDLPLHEFNKALLADTRDVAFQSDPFSLIGDEIVTGLEEGQIDGTPNMSWLAAIYHDDIAAALKPFRIVCSGVTIGRVDLIHEYLTLMWNQIEDCPENLKHGPNLDQAIHNFLIHGNDLPMNLTRNRDGIIATLAYENQDNISWDGERVWVQGKPPAIVHQYDRWPHLKKKFQSLYQ